MAKTYTRPVAKGRVDPVIPAQKAEPSPATWLDAPVTGTILMGTATVCFLVLCMLLPLVGPAGAATSYAGRNAAAFTGMLWLTLVLGAGAMALKLRRTRRYGDPFPRMSTGLCAACLVLQLLLWAGLLRI